VEGVRALARLDAIGAECPADRRELAHGDADVARPVEPEVPEDARARGCPAGM
jgi:hypothetical protein